MRKILNKLHSLSIYTKLAILIFMVITIFSSSVIFLAINTSKNQTNEIINEMIDSNIQSNKDFIVSAILANDRWALFKFLKSFSKNSTISDAGIVDKNFIILAHTDTKNHKMGTILEDRDEHTILPFNKDGVLLGYFILTIQRNSVKNILEKSFSSNFLMMIIAALLSFLLAIYFMKNLLNRLNILVENAKAISLKNWGDIKEIQSAENDEITDLVKNTTYLMKEIQNSAQKEEQLKNFYQQILNSIDVFIIICDEEFNIMYQNNHELKKYILDENIQFKGELVKNLITCYKANSCDFCKQKITGDLGEDISVYYQAKLVNEYLVLSFSDITQLSKLEENDKITHSLKTVGEISSLFAHEIKNLLQPLKLLLQSGEDVDDEDIKIINNALNRMDAQVTDFLSLGKPIDNKETTSLLAKKFIEEIYGILKPNLEEKNIKFITDIDENLEVYISKNSLEMIFLNLINNSIEALDNEGTIEVQWHKRSKSMSLLKIIDSGKGIPIANKKNIFKPFFTTKKDGSGLGLFTVYKIVYLSGGNMKLLDTQKTTFEISLPINNKETTV